MAAYISSVLVLCLCCTFLSVILASTDIELPENVTALKHVGAILM